MKERIISILNKISCELTYHSTDHISIASGETGILLFEILYQKFNGKNLDSAKIEARIKNLAENSFLPNSLQYKASINWFFGYLSSLKLISKEDLKLLNSNENILASYSIKLLELGNYDLFHGSLGIAYYLVDVKRESLIPFYKNYFIILDQLMNRSSFKCTIPYFDFQTKSIDPNSSNFGLSHGIPSVIKYCIQCYKKNIFQEKAKNIAYDLINFLLNNINDDHSQCYFPNMVEFKKKKVGMSRLAWCYGDLGVAYILYQAGKTFKDKNIEQQALKILFHSTTRQDFKDTLLNDAGLCHGSAGISHIYNRMWHYTKDNRFLESRNKWLEVTLSAAELNNQISVYKSYNSIQKSYTPNYGLLEGSAGIGLILLSLLTEDFNWDYCIMLND
ncbi:MAG: lanthionine synthetase LanC family protein [Sediminibacterium sp.]|nr:lanthionine synthetase LanC family protein [Sediminibacterium sp.]